MGRSLRTSKLQKKKRKEFSFGLKDFLQIWNQFVKNSRKHGHGKNYVRKTKAQHLLQATQEKKKVGLSNLYFEN